jgi:hypothetical protein
MFEEAHIAGKKTNHSLRVTGASALFAAGVPERVIQQRTGHRSLDGLRTYERVTEDQNIEVSNILLSNSSTSTTSTKGNDKLTAKENDKPTVKATDLPSLNHPQPSPQPLPANPCGVQYNNCTVNVYPTASPAYPYWPSPLSYSNFPNNSCDY